MNVILCLPTHIRPDLAVECIGSAFAGSLPPSLVYVVDNWGKFSHGDPRVHTINPPGNRGYAGSLNLLHEVVRPGGGTEEVHRTVYCNDDVTFGPEDIRRAVEASESHPFVSLFSFGAFLMREEVWERVGPFDHRCYPAYFDDNDYHHRMRLVGLDVFYLPDATVRHVGSATLLSLPPDHRAAHSDSFRRVAEYYERKWGGPPGQEKFKRPFGPE